MSFVLEPSNYDLKPIKFECDNCLADHIMEPFPNKSFFMIIVGKAGSGKTTFLLNMLTSKGANRIYRKVFDKICLVMPANSRHSIKDDPFDGIAPDQIFEEFGTPVIDKVRDIRAEFDEMAKKDMQKKKPKRNRNQLLILDDVTAYLKQKENMKALVELATNRRHMKLSIVLLVQFLKAIPRPVRFQITDVVFFKPSNRLDLKIISEEYSNLEKEDFDELMRFVYTDSHDFLFISKDTDTYYKNLQKIIMPGNEYKDKIV